MDFNREFPRGLKPGFFSPLAARLKPRPFKAGRWPIVAQGLLVAAIVCASLGATDQQARFEKVGGHLMCTCGCAQSLLGCDHVGCPNRGDEMAKLRMGIAGGQSDAAILDSFVADYGAVVLSAPTTKGIDLLAWIMPFAVSAIALIGTIFLVRHWAKNQPKLAPAGPLDAKAKDEMQERIRRETGTE
jgi:cytochrome c-type biogenesis protein CcmH